MCLSAALYISIMAQSKTEKRSSLWTLICYPESLPDNWEFILSSLHVPVAVSPLHDADVTAQGDEKKPHYHIMIRYDSLKSYSQVCDDTSVLKGTIPQIVKSGKGMIRYFCHLDDPNKHQYQVSDIRCFNGFDISPYLSQTVRERHLVVREMIEYIDAAQIFEVYQFVNYCVVNRFDDWFPVLCGSTFRLIESYIRSRRNFRYEVEDEKRAIQKFKRADDIPF